MADSRSNSRERIRDLGPAALREFVDENLDAVDEAGALAVLENRHCTADMCLRVARNSQLTAYHSVRAALVANRRTPQGWAMRLVPYLYWRELVKLSSDVRVLPPVRRAIDAQLRLMIQKLTLGEKITVARLCSRELIADLLSEADIKVFEALLVNPRMTEEMLVRLVSRNEATLDQLVRLSEHSKWATRYPIRRALALNPRTPPAIAASILRHLRRDDLQFMARRSETSTYLRRCIERLGLLEE